MTASILIVDDEADIRNLMKGILEDEGFRVRLASNSREAYASVQENLPSLVVLDIWLQGSEHDGLKILSTLKETYPHLPIVMISGHGTIETAVSAIRQGAYDFIEKPFKADRLILMIQRALETAHLRRENEALKQKVNVSDEMVGESPAMQNLRQVLLRVAPTNSRILLTGEPGSGKDIAARFIHNNSGRSASPFMVLNCATMRPEHLEIELFGAEEGHNQSAYTGLLERADGGTLLLDEVADMPLETQGKIVRVLQSQSFTKVGGSKSIDVDVRIIASSNRNLEEEIEKGAFRQDLYYRLNVVPIRIPSLRERAQDIPALASYFMHGLSRGGEMVELEFTEVAMVSLKTYSWPGNIRQLRNVMEWVLIMNAGHHEGAYDIVHLPPEISGRCYTDAGVQELEGASGKAFLNQEIMTLPLREAREHFEREYLMAQVARFGGNVSKTAQFVGMERSALHRKLKSLEVAGSDKEENCAGREASCPKTKEEGIGYAGDYMRRRTGRAWDSLLPVA
ncbi:MAG: sigma-54 dependent transcriptional regulator [Alphaproteobacteria bacterium]|nr:sigma-54 dependent transcriptional regulator [Alphaproteobacteria bacterium]